MLSFKPTFSLSRKSAKGREFVEEGGVTVSGAMEMLEDEDCEEARV